MDTYGYNTLILFDGVCDQTKELKTPSGSMSNDFKWIISSSGRYMFLRFAVNTAYWTAYANINDGTGFTAKINYGNEILNQN